MEPLKPGSVVIRIVEINRKVHSHSFLLTATYALASYFYLYNIQTKI